MCCGLAVRLRLQGLDEPNDFSLSIISKILDIETDSDDSLVFPSALLEEEEMVLVLLAGREVGNSRESTEWRLSSRKNRIELVKVVAVVVVGGSEGVVVKLPGACTEWRKPMVSLKAVLTGKIGAAFFAQSTLGSLVKSEGALEATEKPSPTVSESSLLNICGTGVDVVSSFALGGFFTFFTTSAPPTSAAFGFFFFFGFPDFQSAC